MADELYALTARDVDTLRSLIGAWRRRELEMRKPQLRPLSERSDVIVGVADATISGVNGTGQPSFGTFNVYELGSTGAMADSGRDETVYNLSSVALSTDSWTIAVRDYWSGLWVAAKGNPWYIGKVISAAIPSEETGTVQQYDQLWTNPTSTFTVLNPHAIELPVGLKVRWTTYPGWTDWIVEPFDYTECT